MSVVICNVTLFQINIVSVSYGQNIDGSLQCFQIVNETKPCGVQSSLPHVMSTCHNKEKCSIKISHKALFEDEVDACPRIRFLNDIIHLFHSMDLISESK